MLIAKIFNFPFLRTILNSKKIPWQVEGGKERGRKRDTQDERKHIL